MTAPRMVSRLWVQKHARPRDAQGRFLPGRQLWTREDGQTRWIRFLEPDLHSDQFADWSAEDAAIRNFFMLSLVVVVAALLFVFVR